MTITRPCCLFLMLLGIWACNQHHPPVAVVPVRSTAQPATLKASSPTPAVTARATTFLAALTTDQRREVVFPFAEAGREQWHYVPDTMWPRGGLTLGDLNERQKQLLHELLQACLGEKGYEKAVGVIELEGILAELENNPTYRDRERYHVMFYGDPATDTLWSWRLEGHHLSLNFTAAGDTMAYAPRFYGANPATVPSGARKGLSVLKVEAELGLELVNALTDEQRSVAVLQDRTFRDIVSGHESQARPLTPKGLAATAMTQDQQALLFRLIDEYLSAMPEEVAGPRRQNVQREEIADLHFSWAGATQAGRPHYYRIQGKSFLVEFDNSQNSGNHIHTVWRDFDGDFGRDLLREHYRMNH